MWRPRFAPPRGGRPGRGGRWTPEERGKAVCGAMAVLSGVAEELLSEMAAAVRESARRREKSEPTFVFSDQSKLTQTRIRACRMRLVGSCSRAVVPERICMSMVIGLTWLTFFHSTFAVPDEHLLLLKFVFGSSAIQALDLADRQSITLISSPSGRCLYQVLGSSGKTYTCLASCHYCSCPAFAFSVLRKSENLLCKHLLAVYLSQVMGTCQKLSVSDKQLTEILLTEEEQET
ncbi:uncharacterized protein LOC143687230 isoform X1 [Tamandua tetradactyla]|uniref:uncharacterized protein LOC143687230 isoform X1 n=1 Tax=Tamandua tetradactyla TaxID=48850 RepID=UPI004053B0C5